MNISILIPQLFYDVIGRVLPGASLLACAFMLFRGGKPGLVELTTWSNSTTFVLLGNLLASHIIGSLLGGLWFRVYRLNLLNLAIGRKWQERRQRKSPAGVESTPEQKGIEKESKSNESQTVCLVSEKNDKQSESNEPQKESQSQMETDEQQSKSNELQTKSLAKKTDNGIVESCLRGWAKNGENRVDAAFAKIFKEKENWPLLGAHLKMGEIEPTARMALMYDYTQLRCPRAGARIAKLRAEQHMSGVLMIGTLLLAMIYPVFSLLRPMRPQGWWVVGVELILLFGMTTAGWLTWHLEKRAGAALVYSWYLAWSGFLEENRSSDSPKQ